MTMPERPIFTSEQTYVNYLDGLKDDRGIVMDFDFILSLKTGSLFGEFLENLEYVSRYTDYAGFHVSDPNWYEEGKYSTGILHPKFYEELEGYFREQKDTIDGKILEDDQVLTPMCHYSNQPAYGKANLVIEVSGGKRHDWGQFILCHLDKGFNEFDFQENVQVIDSMKKLAREKGRQEISAEETRSQYLERKRLQEEI